MIEKIRNIIERFTAVEDQEKVDLIQLFCNCWSRYFLEGEDTHFEDTDLRRLWALMKIHLLSGLSVYRDAKTLKMLKKEIDRNAKIYLNPKYAVKDDYIVRQLTEKRIRKEEDL